MLRTWMASTAAALVTVAVTLGAVGCGGDDGGNGAVDTETSTLIAGFEEAAEAAYEANDADRRDDFNRGVTIDDGCFVLDGEAAVAVAEALGMDGAGDAEVGPGTFLRGPPGQREQLVCSIVTGEEDTRIGVGAGTVPLDRDELLEEVELNADSNDDEVQQLDGEAPGLDPDDVLAIDRGDSVTFSWIRDDFQVYLTFPDELADADAGFQALPVLVDGVAGTLSDG